METLNCRINQRSYNTATEFQPSFVALHGVRKIRIRTGCYYKSQLIEDHSESSTITMLNSVFEDFSAGVCLVFSIFRELSSWAFACDAIPTK